MNDTHLDGDTPTDDEFIAYGLQQKAEKKAARNPVTDFPAHIERKYGTPVKTRSRQRRGTNTSTNGNHAKAALNAEVEAVRTALKGTRNHTLNTAAFNLGQLVAAGTLSEDDVERELFAAAMECGLGQGETRATINSGLTGSADKPRDLSNVGHNGHDPIGSSDIGEPVHPPTFYDIEQGFWDSRDSLQKIYQAAMARMCAPWAVLGFCVARALTLVRPCITLPPLIGGAGSLNWVAVISAESGGGKGAAQQVAKELVNEVVLERNLGSGEGLVDQYVKTPAKGKEPAALHEAVMFTTNEIDTLAALKSRTGSTLLGTLKSGFSGEPLGFSNRNASSLHLVSHTYRMTVTISAQPKKAAWLFEDIGGGFTQRMMWFPARDKRVDFETPEMPAPLTLPCQSCWEWPKQLEIPDSARDSVKRARVHWMRGQESELDGHALFVQEKFAFGLALLDGRDEMNEQDWDLAGIAMRVSECERNRVYQVIEQAGDEEAEKRGRLNGIAYDAADEEKFHRQAQRSRRISAWIFKKLKTGQLTRAQLRDKANPRDRKHFDYVFTKLAEDRQIEQNGQTKIWTVA